jgi:Family of unknown function (DUF6488)
MIRRTMIAILVCMSLGSLQAFAHEGHDHEEDLTEQQVAQLATKTLPAVIKAKKLAGSWATAERQEITVKSVDNKTIWVVPYKHPDGKTDGGKSLYLFFDELGNFVAANHTGDAPSR